MSFWLASFALIFSKINTVFEIRNNQSGVDISSLSRQNESEILIPSNSVYRVVDIQTDLPASSVYGETKLLIILEEVTE